MWSWPLTLLSLPVVEIVPPGGLFCALVWLSAKVGVTILVTFTDILLSYLFSLSPHPVFIPCMQTVTLATMHSPDSKMCFSYHTRQLGSYTFLTLQTRSMFLVSAKKQLSESVDKIEITRQTSRNHREAYSLQYNYKMLFSRRVMRVLSVL